MYKCCTLDLDGTFMSSVYATQKSANDTLSCWNMREVSVEESRLYAEDSYKKLLERFLIACGDKEPIYYEEAVEWYQDIFRECCMHRVGTYGGIGELLEFLKPQGIFTAVLFNKPHPRALDNVQGVFRKRYFGLVYGERKDKRIKEKSYSDSVWVIAEELGLSKSEIPYLRDTNTNMETGDNTKMDTVGMTWGFRTREELMAFHSALIANHPSRAAQCIKGVNGVK